MSEQPAQDQDSRGTRHEHLMALLVGLIGVVAACLVFLEVSASHDEARATATAARLTSELTTRLNASSAPFGFRLGKTLEASQVALQGTSRQMVSLEASDPVWEAIGAADYRAAERLGIIAQEMGSEPDESGPLDGYARSVLSSTMEELEVLLAEQNRQRDLSDAGSARSEQAVFGLSLLALAGVLAGLAAVVGQGRSGGVLLALGYVLAGGAVVMGAASAEWGAILLL